MTYFEGLLDHGDKITRTITALPWIGLELGFRLVSLRCFLLCFIELVHDAAPARYAAIGTRSAPLRLILLDDRGCCRSATRDQHNEISFLLSHLVALTPLLSSQRRAGRPGFRWAFLFMRVWRHISWWLFRRPPWFRSLRVLNQICLDDVLADFPHTLILRCSTLWVEDNISVGLVLSGRARPKDLSRIDHSFARLVRLYCSAPLLWIIARGFIPIPTRAIRRWIAFALDRFIEGVHVCHF